MAYFLLNLGMQFDKNLIKNEKEFKLKGLWFFGLSGSGKSYASNYINHTNPTEPAVNPTTKKKVNSNKSLGKELTIKLS